MAQGMHSGGVKLSRLDGDAYLMLEGARAREVMQGQATADFSTLVAERVLPGVVCNNRGRAEFDFLAIEESDERVGLRVARDLCSAATERLRPYAMLSRVALAPADRVHVALWGAAADALVTEVFGRAPPPGGCIVLDEGVLIGRELPEPAWECLLHPEQAPARLEALREGSTELAEASWESLNLLGGVVRLNAGSSGREVPQAWNYDLSGHVSFRKGCYTGQEVVARLHYRGESKFRTRLFRCDAQAPPTVGATVYEAASDRKLGEVVNVAPAPAAGWLVLALVRADDAAAELREMDTALPLLPQETGPDGDAGSG